MQVSFEHRISSCLPCLRVTPPFWTITPLLDMEAGSCDRHRDGMTKVPMLLSWESAQECGESGQIETVCALTTMMHQINLQKARAILLPLSEGPDGNRVLEQSSWLRNGKRATSSQPLPGMQQPIHGRRAHPAKSSFYLSTYKTVPVSPQDRQ